MSPPDDFFFKPEHFNLILFPETTFDPGFFGELAASLANEKISEWIKDAPSVTWNGMYKGKLIFMEPITDEGGCI